MDNIFIEYAPIIIVVIGFLTAYRIFVTPNQLQNEISKLEKELDKKYVQKEVYKVVITELKEDISEIKEKLDIIYNAIINKNKVNK